MPVSKVPGGFQWGNSGKVYPNQAGAQAQQAAAFANGFKENQDSKAQAKKTAIQNLMKKHSKAKQSSGAAEEAGEPKLSPAANAKEEAAEKNG